MAIVIKKNERLYLNNWQYNIAIIMTELAKIIENEGGRVKPHPTAIISNRTVLNSDPVRVTHTNYITFVYDGFYYYYQVDDNPFFDFYYRKTKLNGNKYSRNVYLEKDKKEWVFDCLFSYECTQAERKEIANLIFNYLVSAKESERYREKEKIMVPNVYNDGYHYETVCKPERMETVNF